MEYKGACGAIHGDNYGHIVMKYLINHLYMENIGIIWNDHLASPLAKLVYK